MSVSGKDKGCEPENVIVYIVCTFEWSDTPYSGPRILKACRLFPDLFSCHRSELALITGNKPAFETRKFAAICANDCFRGKKDSLAQSYLNKLRLVYTRKPFIPFRAEISSAGKYIPGTLNVNSPF